MTSVVGVLLYFLIADFPEDVKWLTPEEREYIRVRLQDDVGESMRHKQLTPSDVLTVLKDRKQHCSDTRL